MSYLRNQFAGAVEVGGFFSSSLTGGPERNNDGADPQAAQNQSLLKSLAPNLKTNVNATNLNQHAVAADKNAAASLVEPNRNIVENVKGDIQDVKADISETIRQAQKEVAAMAQEAGYDIGEMYPDTRMGAMNETGMYMQVGLNVATGLAALKGAGSYAMKALKGAPEASVVMNDRAGSNMSLAEAEARIEDMLRAASSAPEDSRMEAVSGVLTSEAEPEIKPSGLDWNQFFDDGHELSDLMSIDPDNPSPALVPEWAALDQIEANADRVLDELVVAEEIIEENPHLALPEVVQRDVAINTGDVELTGQFLNDLNGVGIDETQVAALDSDTHEMLARLQREMEIRQLEADVGASFKLNSSAMT